LGYLILGAYLLFLFLQQVSRRMMHDDHHENSYTPSAIPNPTSYIIHDMRIKKNTYVHAEGASTLFDHSAWRGILYLSFFYLAEGIVTAWGFEVFLLGHWVSVSKGSFGCWLDDGLTG
jgi:hypothetical protein